MMKLYLFSLILCIFMLDATENSDDFMPNLEATDDVIALFPKTGNEINQIIERSMKEARELIERIIAIPNEQRTFENTALALDRVRLSRLFLIEQVLGVLKDVSSDEAINKIANEGVIRIRQFRIKYISSNRALYDTFKVYVQGNAVQEKLSPEQHRLLEVKMREWRSFDLPDDIQKQVKKLKKELEALEFIFDRHVAHDKTVLSFERDALRGMGQDFIDTLARTEDGRYMLQLNGSFIFFNQLLANCSLEDTRRQIFLSVVNRAYPINEQLLKEIISKRDRLAQLQGFASYAHLDLKDRMVKTPERAHAFLDKLVCGNLAAQIKVQSMSDFPESVALTKDGKIKPWDVDYCIRRYLKKHFAIDQNVSHYFPMEKAMKGVFDCYERFLGVKFEEVAISGTWHEDVRLIKIYSKDQLQLMGYILLDLFPRPNKFCHVAAIYRNIVPAIIKDDGTRLPLVSVLMTNFRQATLSKPVLLSFVEFRMFAELIGREILNMLSATRMASLGDANDELLSLLTGMLGNWFQDKAVLKRVSSHYKTGEHLSDALVDRIIANDRCYSAFKCKKHIFLSKISLDYFLRGEDKDPYEIWQKLHQKLNSEIEGDKNDHLYASFAHLAGYGPRFYGYLWSKVFALDLFHAMKSNGLFNPDTCKKFMEDVVGRINSHDSNELLHHFLGREPSSDAFVSEQNSTIS